MDLSGTWQFRFETSPYAEPAAWSEVTVPSAWSRTAAEAEIGVYRRLIEVDADGEWAVGIGEIISAYELSADGTLVGARGGLPPVGRIDHGHWKSWTLPRSVTADGFAQIELRVWDPPGGQPGGLFPGPVFFGPSDEVQARIHRRGVDRLSLAAVFLAVGFYHLFIFFFRPRLSGYLYFGLLSVAVSAYTLALSQWCWQILDNFAVWKRLEMLSISLIAPLALIFVMKLLQRPMGWFSRTYLVISLVFAGIFALAPLAWVIFLFPFWLRWAVIAVTWTCWLVFAGWRDRHPEARTLVWGYAIASVAFLHDVAAGAGLLTTPLLSAYGFAILTFSMALSLAHRFVRIYEEVDDLRQGLETRVRQRTGELKAARDEAQAASAAKSSFLAHMSHEIRTPMNGVLGMADLLARSELDDTQRSRVETIRSSASVLLRILGDLLDLSRVEAGKLELRDEPFDLHQICRTAIDLAVATVGQKQLDLTCRIADGVPQWVRGDGARLGQVLFNLLGNAVKFTESGRVDLRVVASRKQEGWIEFCVSDTGIGMGDDTLHRVFKPFEQGDSSTQRRFGGSGLGLAISRRLVSLAGGRIDVASAPGTGSEFLVKMPLPATTAPPPESQEGRVAVEPGLRVLLVEDEPVNRMVAQAWLESLQAEVVVAEDGVEALDLLEASTESTPAFDVVFMDCRLPRLDGYETTRRWRSIERQKGLSRLPIIAVTAHAVEGEAERCFTAGMDEFLTKPLRTLDLRQALERTLAGR